MKIKKSLLVLVFLLVVIVVVENISQLTNYKYRRIITLNRSKVSGSEDLLNFPFYFQGTFDFLRTEKNGGGVASSSGYDIAFATDYSGNNLIPYELRSYNENTGEIKAFLKIPIYYQAKDTNIYLFYGDSNMKKNKSDKESVWEGNKIMQWYFDSFSDMVWQRHGIVITPSKNYEVAIEPTIMYEGDPRVLTGETYVFKVWYSEGYYSTAPGSIGISYAESTDMVNWVSYASNPVISSELYTTSRSCIMKHNGVYYAFVYNSSGSENGFYSRLSSTDGINWNLDQREVLNVSDNGWDSYHFGNVWVWVEGENNWKMLYEASPLSPVDWQIGLATSSDGLNWTKNLGNPVTISDSGSVAASEVWKFGDKYHLLYHGSVSGVLPTDIFHVVSSDLISWSGPEKPMFYREKDYEGMGNIQGQVADPSFVNVGDTAYMIYDAIKHQAPPPTHNLALTTFKTDSKSYDWHKTFKSNQSDPLGFYIISEESVVTPPKYSVIFGNLLKLLPK